MVDFNIPIKGRKGFYVRMKFLHSNHKHGRNKEIINHNFKRNSIIFYRAIKWFVWLFISFYLFISFPPLRNHYSPPPSLSSSSPLSSSSLAKPRALAETQDTDSSSLDGDIKIYVYELPAKYNQYWVQNNERCTKHLFASEVAIHRALLESNVRTFDPNQADFFFVPVYVSCNFSTVNGFPAVGHARSLISSAVTHVSSGFPFWNRSRGADHIFVASHDFGACFHTMENVAIEDGIMEELRGSIILQTFGVKYIHPCQAAESVVVPPYIPPESVRATAERWPLDGRRDIFAFFRGKMEVNPKNVSGRFYSKAVRTHIWRNFNNNRRFYLKRHRYAGYQSEIAWSVFCLCPLGWAPWSPRLVESVALGCIPVIIADGIKLPFEDVVPWANISLTVAERDVAKLGTILDHVSRTNLTAIQRNLWDPNVSRALLFNHRIEKGDATWQVLRTLSAKLAHHRSRVSEQ
ncbi:probable glucuronoxylan glucuronosyltransferase F8H [Chenopodium quinoa]|uniref:probable glucuronoxylan glucuronosyltransferase F8H n=1 Tax=Chenopodium quinoa TaxID=63459 RepID=UPI000B79A660|nr:probable glucuronoxylan glucuronosyltransferase F8H [Chenopodium quinoa]